MTDLVSVIIPSYNRGHLIREAIASVQAQTYGATEVIVIDDGSTDGTAAIVEGLRGVTYVAQERRGSGAARTRGLELARGDLVASLDSDDVWYPRFLERSVAALRDHDLDIVFANWTREPTAPSYLDIERHGGRLARFQTDRRGDWWLLRADQVRAMFLAACPAPSSSLLFRRSSMPNGWNADLHIADDWYLVLDMVLERPCRAAFTLTPLWTKRVDGHNKYDGRALSYIVRELHVHDEARFRHDFAPRLTALERLRWRLRGLKWQARLGYLRLRDGADTEQSSRERAPASVSSSTAADSPVATHSAG